MARKTCKFCRKVRPLPSRPVHKDVPMSTYENDPYCTRACYEADHGITNSGIAHSGSPRKEVAA